MIDRAAFRAGVAGAVLAVVCCAAPLLVVSVPLAGLGTWLAGVGVAVLPSDGGGFRFRGVAHPSSPCTGRL